MTFHIELADDADWDRDPTALEAAHYDALLAKKTSDAAERSRKLFGDCLLKLTKMKVPEKQARSMLGKWRGQAKDDARLIAIVEKAFEIAAPDPISYITKAVKGSADRSAKTTALQKNSWTQLGWEPPKNGPNGPTYKGSVRGQVWRDPFGKVSVLPAKPGVTPPTADEDPGYMPQKVTKAA